MSLIHIRVIVSWILLFYGAVHLWKKIIKEHRLTNTREHRYWSLKNIIGNGICFCITKFHIFLLKQTNEMNQYLLYILQIHVHSLHTLLKKNKQTNTAHREMCENVTLLISIFDQSLPLKWLTYQNVQFPVLFLFVYICYF